MVSENSSKLIDLIYIGTSVEAVIFLKANNNFNLLKVFCMEGKLSDDLEEASKTFNIELFVFKDSEALTNLILSCSTKIIFFIYQLDLLIAKSLTLRYKLYNVHRGSLTNNRGPTPDTWSILLGERFTDTSLHLIDERIDAGILVKAVTFSIPVDTNLLELRNLHHSNLPCLIQYMAEFEKNNIKGFQIPKSNKGYRPWVQEKDIYIDFFKDNWITFKRKFLSQIGYNGVIIEINNKIYFINKYLLCNSKSFEKLNKCKIEFMIISQTKKHILVYWHENVILLYINTSSFNRIPKKNLPKTNLI